MIIPDQSGWVGEHLPIRLSFLNKLKSFTGQTLVALSVTWVSETPSIVSFDAGSEGVVSSDEGLAQGIPLDACIGRFEMLAAGICTVYVTVDTLNPVATYVGTLQFRVESIPTP
jgi:hypothetical protein